MNSEFHWTKYSTEDFVFRIAVDFIFQLENKMAELPMSQDQLAKNMGVTKGRISQIFNNPGNLSLASIVKCANALKMKVAIVAYEDSDPENKKGPINSEIFKLCWEASGRPRDNWALQEVAQKKTIGDVMKCQECLMPTVVSAPNPTRINTGTIQITAKRDAVTTLSNWEPALSGRNYRPWL